MSETFTGTCPTCYRSFGECQCHLSTYISAPPNPYMQPSEQETQDEKHPLLYVRWKDILNYTDRVFISIIKEIKLIDVETVGFLVHEDDEKITLSQNKYDIPDMPELTAENSMIIPKADIYERRICVKED